MEVIDLDFEVDFKYMHIDPLPGGQEIIRESKRD